MKEDYKVVSQSGINVVKITNEVSSNILQNNIIVDGILNDYAKVKADFPEWKRQSKKLF